MNRHELDRFAAAHRLGTEAIATALTLTRLRPTAAEWRAFGSMSMRGAGLGALGAGALFFVAANWQAFGLLGRFALLQAALLLSVALAVWRPPPAPFGRGALIIATVVTGGLLALFGQSYQTGADLHELFFVWALLTLPFALAALSGALWALWFGVLNVALALLCGWSGPDHFFWTMAFGGHIERSTLLMLPFAIDLLAAGVFVALRRTRWRGAAPAWLARGAAVAAFAFGTSAVIVVVVSAHGSADARSVQGTAALALFATLSIGLGLATLRHRRDVFPLALLSASATAIGTAWLLETLPFSDVGSWLVTAAWLVVASTVSGMLLMRFVRSWHAPASTTMATTTTEGTTA